MKSIYYICVLFALSLLSSTTVSETYILVHDAFQSSYQWEGVEQQLSKKGHKVVVVNLPGRNVTGHVAKAITLNDYITIIRDMVASEDAPILVGHGFAGIIITAYANKAPESIKKLVYIGAYVPRAGESMQSLIQMDKESGFTKSTLVVSPDYSSASILDEDKIRLFIQDGSEKQQQFIADSMIREPLGPIVTPVVLSHLMLDEVDKAYVRTMHDQVISMSLQTSMVYRASITEVYNIPSGHAPQISHAKELVDVLDSLSK